MIDRTLAYVKVLEEQYSTNKRILVKAFMAQAGTEQLQNITGAISYI